MLCTHLGFFTLFSLIRAHFTLDYPYTRGLDHDKEPVAPCGGFGLNKTRTPFPISGAFISYTSHHQNAVSVAGISFSSNPTSLTDFNTTSDGKAYPLLVPSWNTTVAGSFCIHVNASSVGVPITNGQNATIVMVYNGGDEPLYQCSDLTLLSNYTIPSSISCQDAGTVTGGSTTSFSPYRALPQPAPRALHPLRHLLAFFGLLLEFSSQ